MRSLTAGALIIALAAPALAQRQESSGIQPSLAPGPAPHGHPYLDRAEYLNKRTVAAGAVIGILAGALQKPSATADREDKALTGAVIGGAFGVLTGAAAAGVSSFVPPAPRSSFEHRPLFRTRHLSRYLGFGAQLGTSFGVLFAMQAGAGKVDDPDTELDQIALVISGLAIGFVIGGLLYLVQH